MRAMSETRHIEISLEGDLLNQLDVLAEKEHATRATLIDRACRLLVEKEATESAKKANEAAWDEAYVAGYIRIPEDESIGLAQEAELPYVLPAEDW